MNVFLKTEDPLKTTSIKTTIEIKQFFNKFKMLQARTSNYLSKKTMPKKYIKLSVIIGEIMKSSSKSFFDKVQNPILGTTINKSLI